MTEAHFESVWDALEDTPSEAANMKARAEIMLAIRAAVEDWNVTQTEAARRLGVTQPRLSELMRGRIDRFSLDALLNLASAADLAVEWRLKPRAA